MPKTSNLLDDHLIVGLFILALIAFILWNLFLWRKGKGHCKDFFPFVMYFIALGYGGALIIHMICLLAHCCETILSFTEPKLDTKFMIFGSAAMLQYGFTGLVNTMRGKHN